MFINLKKHKLTLQYKIKKTIKNKKLKYRKNNNTLKSFLKKI